MLDANDYRHAREHPAAERCLRPRHLDGTPAFWRASTPIEDALAAPVGPKSTAIHAIANHGQWVAECPDCHDAQLTAIEDPRFMCVGCGNAAVGGKWRPVIWPKGHVEIGELLDARPRHLANTLPGETVEQIRRENALLEKAVLLDDDPGDPTGNPHHPHWQGHTHKYPSKSKRDLKGDVVCTECGFTVSAQVLAAHEAGDESFVPRAEEDSK